jgi:hypothetical protein
MECTRKIGGAGAMFNNKSKRTSGTKGSAGSTGSKSSIGSNTSRGRSKGQRYRLTLKNKFNNNITHNVEGFGDEIFMRPPQLRRVNTDSRVALYELLQDNKKRKELITTIRILLARMKFPTRIMVLNHIYKEASNDFYVNFDNGSHLSVHYNRLNGGEKGHIHISDESTGVTIRIAIFVDESTGLNIIGMCYHSQEHADLKFLAKVCSKSIKTLLESNSSKKYKIKKICTVDP